MGRHAHLSIKVWYVYRVVVTTGASDGLHGPSIPLVYIAVINSGAMSLLAIIAIGIFISYILSKFIRWIFYPALKRRPADTPENEDQLLTHDSNRCSMSHIFPILLS